jgi:ABC-2 type transport system permease protein
VPPALSPSAQPPRPTAVSAMLAFGWRSVLRIKHVPDQLFDVIIAPDGHFVGE